MLPTLSSLHPLLCSSTPQPMALTVCSLPVQTSPSRTPAQRQPSPGGSHTLALLIHDTPVFALPCSSQTQLEPLGVQQTIIERQLHRQAGSRQAG